MHQSNGTVWVLSFIDMAGLYIHIPFCESKCIYCDFYPLPLKNVTNRHQYVKKYLSALSREIAIYARDESIPKKLNSIYFGGGTPSILEVSDIEKILESIHFNFEVSKESEITLEANPGTLDIEKLKILRSLGINRLSLGVQSFYDEDLKFLSRIHTAYDVFQIVKDTNDANFNNISFDLIFSLPEQTIEKWKSNLQKAVEIHPTHISCYSLIIEPETPLFTMVHYKGVSVLSEENDAELYEFTIEFLNNNGYRQYEVSNFAKSGFESVHNKNYWNHIPYIGLGQSSHSFFNTKRWWNFRNIDRYIESLNNNILPIESEEVLTKQQMINEFIYLGLRSEGINLNKLKESYCTDLLPIKKNLIENFVNGNLMICDGSYLKLTPTGYVMCDEICAELAL